MHRTVDAEKGNQGGGIALGVLNDLEPSWISEGDNEAEAITIEIGLKDFRLDYFVVMDPRKVIQNKEKINFWTILIKKFKTLQKTELVL